MNLSGRAPFQKAPKGPSKADGLAYMRRVKQLPCVVCNAPPPSDCHHVCHDRYGSRRASDYDTIPLCKIHHQDGPEAIHNNKTAWREKNGPDHGYVNQVRADLGLPSV